MEISPWIIAILLIFYVFAKLFINNKVSFRIVLTVVTYSINLLLMMLLFYDPITYRSNAKKLGKVN